MFSPFRRWKTKKVVGNKRTILQISFSNISQKERNILSRKLHLFTIVSQLDSNSVLFLSHSFFLFHSLPSLSLSFSFFLSFFHPLSHSTWQPRNRTLSAHPTITSLQVEDLPVVSLPNGFLRMVPNEYSF